MHPDRCPRPIQRRARARAIGAVACLLAASPPAVTAAGLTATAAFKHRQAGLGEPVELTLTLSGDFDAARVQTPDLNAQPAVTRWFAVSGTPTRKLDHPNRLVFTYLLRPTETGTIELPPIDVYDDEPATGVRRRTASRPTPLRVDLPSAADRETTVEWQEPPALAPLDVDPAGSRPSGLVWPRRLRADATRTATRRERQFLWDQANAAMTLARTAEEYLNAADLYRALMASGVRNGPVCYNLGTALLKAGAYPQARHALERAERYLGSRPDVRRNLALTVLEEHGGRDSPADWRRLFFFWHFGLAAPTRLFFAAWACAGICLGLVLRRRGRLRCGKAIMALSAAVLILMGGSVAITCQAEAADRTVAARAAGGACP